MLNKDVLNINPEVIYLLISKFKEFHVKEGVTFNEEISDSEYEYDWSQILADHKDDNTYLEIQTVINDLEPDQKIDLLTLLYIGRGDFDIDEWSVARKEAKSNLAPHLAHYLVTKPFIADYLEKALELLGYSSEE